MRIMSIRTRLTLSFSVLFGAIVIALAIAAYLLVRNDAYSRLDSALQVAAGATAMSGQHELSEHATKAAGEKDLQSVLDDTGGSDVADTQILVREGARIGAYKPGALTMADLRTIPVGKLRNRATAAALRIAARSLPVPKFHTVYRIYSAEPVAPVLRQLEHIRVALLLLVPIGLGLASIAGYLFAAKSLRPLQSLARTIDAVTSSDLSARVEVNGRDEIGMLGTRFNALLDRLQNAFTIHRRFMADASHQIRTPVAVALTASQVVTRDPNAELRDCKDSLQVIEHQMLQLRRTVEDMFFLSHADTASLRPDRKEMYLDDAITGAVQAARMLANAKEQHLTVKGLREAKCFGDESLLRQAVLTLLDNAVKFTPIGGCIEVSLENRGGWWVCSVVDNGRGISEAAQSRIFERFFRESPTGNEAVPGAGLGLAIAKSIVESHGGRITLAVSRPGHTSFELALPALEGDGNTHGVQANSFAVRM
jgi:signal transduction histidine kinase